MNLTMKKEELFVKVTFGMIDPMMSTNWIHVLGAKTFCAWLMLRTMVDRKSGMERFGNDCTIPLSLNEIMKALGMKKTTFYRNVIKPLWNYGLIDIAVAPVKGNNGLQPMNIVVYPSPLNNPDAMSLEILRNYDQDYHSEAKSFGELGVVIKAKQLAINYESELERVEKARYEYQQSFNFKQERTEGSNFETIEFSPYFDGPNFGTYDELAAESPVLEDSKVGIEPNLEPTHRYSNLNPLNSFISVEEEEDNKFNDYNAAQSEPTVEQEQSEKALSKHRQLLSQIEHDELLTLTYLELVTNQWVMKDIELAIELLKTRTFDFTFDDVKKQLTQMAYTARTQGIFNFGVFFVNGLEKKAAAREMIRVQEAKASYEKEQRIQALQERGTMFEQFVECMTN